MVYDNVKERFSSRVMKIFTAQIDPIIGDMDGNTNKIIHMIDRARYQKCDIVLFPEMSICGYPADDLLFFDDFIESIEHHLQKIIESSKGLLVIVGLARRSNKGKLLYNSAAIIRDGVLLGYKDKTLLPYYDVFNEQRYFEPGEKEWVFEYKNLKIGVLICEDSWQHSADITETRYAKDPVLDLIKLKPDLILIPAASPYYFQKNELRKRVYGKVAKTLNADLIYCAQVGANDQLVFDGYSMYFNKEGKLKQMAKGFETDEFIIDLKNGILDIEEVEPLKDLYSALVLGVKDYFKKQGLTKACIGLSGGIDSSLTACIAVDALGAQNVLGLRLPSRFSSISSIEDVDSLAENLRIELLDLSIDSIYQRFLDLFSPIFKGKPYDTTEENIQARIRSVILMGVSNKLGYVVLSTGNKSEMAMGYTTIYGDMSGGLAVLGDLTKTMIYKLVNFINKHKEIIPNSIITKPPSAELRENQKDSDTLPPYEIVDLILSEYVENHRSLEEIHSLHKIPKDLLRDLINRIHIAEFKRRQGPICIEVTKKAFGRGRIFPIVQGWI